MDDDHLLRELRTRSQQEGRALPPRATRAEVDAFERATDLRLPVFYVRLLTEVANGGFGPGFGMIGIPPNGHAEADLRANLLDAYLEGRSYQDIGYRTPRGLLAFCTWGCAIFSYVDCLSELGAVVTDEAFQDRIEYTETAPSLAGWFAEWLGGTDLEGAMHRVVGFREGINPFTREPIKIPTRERIGRRLQFNDRG